MTGFRTPHLLMLALTAGLAAGCAGRDSTAPDPLAPPAGMIYSPNGEPLNGGPLGKPTCREAMARWFDRVDSGHQGAIGREAFLADARAQFQRMDIDGNGYLVPEELERYRLPYRQPQPAPRRSASEDRSGEQSEGLFGGHHHHAADPTETRGGNHSDAQPDPVMAADTQMTFKVTLNAFLTQAATTFAKLDTRHRGVLDQADILGQCQPKAAPPPL